MPTVLITGLNGFLAVHTALVFLSHDWSVRGTVRSSAKAENTKKLPSLSKYVSDGRVELVVVEDLIKGDFSEALKGVDAIAHCASPVHFKGDTWAGYRDPAVKGTTNLLEQAAAVPSVTAISVAGSFASVGPNCDPASEHIGEVYTEADWLPETAQDCENVKDTGDGAAQNMWYNVSKKDAEIAARETQKRLEAKYTLSIMCPPMLFGPTLHFGPTTPKVIADSDLSTSILYTVLAAGKDAPVPATKFPTWADIRNVAQAMYEAVAQKKDERYCVSNGIFDYQTIANIARKQRPDLLDSIPLGDPKDTPSFNGGTYTINCSKVQKELGIQFNSLEDMVRDTVQGFVDIGVIKA